MRNGDFFSRGKLLLSGEYYVLYGAKALALPLRFGQRMQVKEIQEPGLLIWETNVMGEKWFNATFNLKDPCIIKASDEKTALFLMDLLNAGSILQPELKTANQGFYIHSSLDFDIRWGLGSSSSLISNLAYWLDIDPFQFFRRVLPGSGFDVFCARASMPIIYHLDHDKPMVESVSFSPVFRDNLFFIYLGSKQDSQQSVRRFREGQHKNQGIISEISHLTESLTIASSLKEFCRLLRLHEETLSGALGLPMVRDLHFPDFDGEIKSLGAWGGDFILAASGLPAEQVKEYFHKRNLSVIFRYDDIVC